MGRLSIRRVVTKDYCDKHGRHFYIISCSISGMTEDEKKCIHYEDGQVFFGTLPYDYVDHETGKTCRSVSLADIWHGRTIAEAITRREDEWEASEFIKNHKELFSKEGEN